MPWRGLVMGRVIRDEKKPARQIRAYCAQLSEVPRCDIEDREAKNAKIEEFATELYRHGGQAVNMITKLFGEETAKRVIVQHMYGVD